MNRPSNLTIYPRQSDVAPFYNSASVVLNLSDKTRFIETFGMTALEAMSAGLPVVVPTEGGIAEMVEDGVNGYKIDVCNLDDIRQTIAGMLSDKDLYIGLAGNCEQIAKHYSGQMMVDSIEAVINATKENEHD